uniref:Uncharacterized protein n=2 Tax=Nemorhina TaxID=44051 RepID=A0A1B0AUS4_9MUSC
MQKVIPGNKKRGKETMGSPAFKPVKEAIKSSDSSLSRVSMTTSTIDDNFVESKLFSWMRLFRFASLLCRAE